MMPLRIWATLLLLALFVVAGLIWFSFRMRRLAPVLQRGFGEGPKKRERKPSPLLAVIGGLAIFSGAACGLSTAAQLKQYRIPSGAMMPTLKVGDLILVDKLAYGLRTSWSGAAWFGADRPQRGDVIVFEYPGYSCVRDGAEVRSGKPCSQPLEPVPETAYIKRVIGRPGDTVRYKNKTLSINEQPIEGILVGPFGGEDPDSRRMAALGAERVRETGAGPDHDVLRIPLRAGAEGAWQVPEGNYFVMGDNRDNSEDSRYWGFVPEQNIVGKAILVLFSWNDGFDGARTAKLVR